MSWDLQSRSLNTSALWVAYRQTDQNFTHEHKASQNEANAMATHHRYKRGHTPHIQKGPKCPTVACGTKCNLLHRSCHYLLLTDTAQYCGKTELTPHPPPPTPPHPGEFQAMSLPTSHRHRPVLWEDRTDPPPPPTPPR